ncbi:MAG: CGNR zinc finger domain-containing protein [Bacillota bacterium]|nr:CGNR zinc finger domain-containing protein [Bacillota bacterium]
MKFAFLELLNSDWHDYRGSGRSEDRIEDPSWLDRFLSRWGWKTVGLPDRAGRDDLRALRSLLRRLSEDFSTGRHPSEQDLAALNAVLAKTPTVQRVTRAGEAGYRVEQVPLQKDWDWVLGEIAASFVELLVHHDPRRIKVCENPDCGWVFYDESRSRTRRWCDARGCGNLLKVRRFRRRRRSARENQAEQASSN